MLYSLGANLLVIVHLLFICFVLAGGLLLIKWRWLIFFHLPAVFWALLLEFKGLICPLTPLEQMLRNLGNQEGYSGGFIQHYLIPVIYPPALDETLQIVLGTVVLVINAGVYLWLFFRHGHK